MKDSLKKYITKTYFYHLETGTEDGFIFDKFICSIVTPFNFCMGFKRGLIDEIPYTKKFLSPRNQDRRWFQL